MNRESFPIWDHAIPHDRGDAERFVPTITPYIVGSAPLPAEGSGGVGLRPAGGRERPSAEMPQGMQEPASRAAVIVFPGGGYTHRAEHEREPIALWLNSLGLNSYVLDYRIKPYRHPAPLLDARRAIRWVRSKAAEHGTNPARVGVIGFSAGGHLAASVGTLPCHEEPPGDSMAEYDPRPDAMILCYPVITFGPSGHPGCIRNLLGPEAPDELRESLSCELNVTPDTAPAFLWHTADDPVVPVEHSLLFAGALSANRVPFALHVFPSGAHGLGLCVGEKADAYVGSWKEQCRLWLGSIGFLPL